MTSYMLTVVEPSDFRHNFGGGGMPERTDQRVSFLFLCVSPFLVASSGVRFLHATGIQPFVTAAELLAMSIAAWNLGLFTVRRGSEHVRMCAISGALLLTPWLLFSLLVGIGAPPEATLGENQIRYFIIGMNGIAFATGFVLLRETVREAGERLYSTIGLAATMLAGPIYVTAQVAPLALEDIANRERGSSATMPNWLAPMFNAADMMLIFASMLIYLATAAFAVSLARTQWVSRRASRVYAFVCVLAILFIVIAVLTRIQFLGDNSTIFGHWYVVPGFIVSIPAVPLVMPALIGVVMLRRSGRATIDQDAARGPTDLAR